MSKGEKVIRWLASAKLTGWMFPFRCSNCGAQLCKAKLAELPVKTQQKHRQAGTDGIYESFAYMCEDECLPDQAFLVI
jgi:hypothetical protein